MWLDSTTSSKMINPKFFDFFDQLEQLLEDLFVYLLLLNNRIGLKIREHSGFAVSKLVVGFSEQDTKVEKL